MKSNGHRMTQIIKLMPGEMRVAPRPVYYMTIPLWKKQQIDASTGTIESNV
jgi:hypothetical protein